MDSGLLDHNGNPLPSTFVQSEGGVWLPPSPPASSFVRWEMRGRGVADFIRWSQRLAFKIRQDRDTVPERFEVGCMARFRAQMRFWQVGETEALYTSVPIEEVDDLEPGWCRIVYASGRTETVTGNRLLDGMLDARDAARRQEVSP